MLSTIVYFKNAPKKIRIRFLLMAVKVNPIAHLDFQFETLKVRL